VRALDAGMAARDGTIVSFGDGEPFVLTTWAEGAVYAEDLRRVAREGVWPRDLRRVDLLADHLAGLHRREDAPPVIYRRAVRDLLGAGEGIFGIVDAYPADTPAASPARLRGIEERCLAWRWRLRDRTDRLCRIHGDFHPFNLLFDDGDHLATLDASRGCAGDPADDLTALSINYVFFAIDREGAWRGGLGALWHRFWKRYLGASGDRDVLDVAAPWLAWRALVVACPRWYPDVPAAARDRLLAWIERVLDAPRLDPASADEVAP
jgi:aminoglycoside phosphotransferase (APT) family kinase protein